MTVCNMSIEAGARAGLIAPDDTTFAYLEGRPFAPKGAAWEHALDDWRALVTDDDAPFDKEVVHRRRHAAAARSRGAPTRRRPSRSTTSCPTPTRSPTRSRATAQRARSRYMGLKAGTPIRDIAVDTVFIGSCTNSRIEDLRAAAAVVARPARCTTGMRTLVVPGSMRVKAEAEAEGLDEVFIAAGFDWREAGCSMCLAMNPDKLAARRALRVDVEPQLRGPPGQGRAHPPRVPRRRRRHRDRRPLRHPRRSRLRGRVVMEAVQEIIARAVPLDRGRRRHRPDHPERLAQAGRAHRLRRGAVLGVARELRLRAQPGALRRREDPRRRARTSAPARRASTRCGRSRTTASTP